MLPVKAECQCIQDCCWVEVNMATLTYWGYYQILDIDVSLSIYIYITVCFSVCLCATNSKYVI